MKLHRQQKTWDCSAAWTGAAVAFAATAYVASNASIAQADAASQVSCQHVVYYSMDIHWCCQSAADATMWFLQAPMQPPADPYALPSATGHLPKDITLYQYEVCPFCCKVKAFLDYHKVCIANDAGYSNSSQHSLVQTVQHLRTMLSVVFNPSQIALP